MYTQNTQSKAHIQANKNLTANQLIETKYKLKKAEQEITTLQGAVCCHNNNNNNNNNNENYNNHSNFDLFFMSSLKIYHN